MIHVYIYFMSYFFTCWLFTHQVVARLQAKLVLGLAAANVKIRGRILFAVRGCETILFST